jgi:hypothetical protein
MTISMGRSLAAHSLTTASISWEWLELDSSMGTTTILLYLGLLAISWIASGMRGATSMKAVYLST